MVKQININPLIHEIHGHQVMLDSDLAVLYGIQTFRLNEAVKRNIHKFPTDFIFQLTETEWQNLIFKVGISKPNLPESTEYLRSQIATSNDYLTDTTDNILISQIAISKETRGGRRKLPFVFTEHGITMLSSVLNSPKAVEINIAVVRSFIAMRHYVAQPIEKKIDDLEKILMLHIDDTNHNMDDHATKINDIIEALNRLIAEPPKPKNKIGFRID